ncbi:hypothetical protein AGOR_G00098200 [Albula goreensis]|uniref:Uncharacterized protein n=1 Tax=Albula goreensis TaxID=1534307 RepID=A0A8T3DN33_9TELE|nr:hypothetical protein AGOR_G00098200 [Albula goreensis]
MMSQACRPSDNATGTTCPVRRSNSKRRRWRRRKCRALRESQARLQRPLEEEDWEKEIKESSLPSKDWSKGVYDSVYDPEDVICPSLQQMTLSAVQNLSPKYALYSPAVHHMSPVKWVQHAHHAVADQFVDAEE